MIDLHTPLVLNSDVVVRDTAGVTLPGVRETPEDEYLLTRTSSRAPSLTVNRSTAELALAFVRPTSLFNVLPVIAERTGTNATAMLRDAYATIQAFVERGILAIPAKQKRHVPRRFGTWTIEATLNAFEDTSVYLVKDTRGTYGALKTAANVRAAAALLRERVVLERLGGVIAPRLLDSGQAHEATYIVTEWIAGAPATDYCRELRGARDRAGLLRGAASILRAFQSLHDAGIIHGDVQPKNVMFDLHDRAWLIDFTHSAAPWLAAPAGRMGVPFFFEPEYATAILADRIVPISRAGETYAVGAMLYFLLCGVYCAEFSLDRRLLLQQIANDAPRAAHDPDGRTWTVVDQALAPLLAKQPSERPTRLDDAAACLDALAGQHARAPAVVPHRVDPERVLNERYGLAAMRTRARELIAPYSSLAYGAAGIAYTLARASLITGDAELLWAADAWIEHAEQRSQEREAFTSTALQLGRRVIGRTSLSNAEPGLYFAKAIVRHATSDGRGASLAIAQFLEATKDSAHRPADVNLGGLGIALAASRLLTLAPPSQQRSLSALRDRMIARALDRADRPIARRRRLGFAHGVAGLVFASVVAGQRAAVERQILDLRRKTIALQRGVHWAVRDGIRHFMVGWCNGIAGHLLLWNELARSGGTDDDHQLAERAAWGVWESRTSLGNMCCGASGQAIALAAYADASANPTWRARACELVEALEPQWARDDNPQSLFRGELGYLLARLECRAGVAPSFPVYGAR